MVRMALPLIGLMILAGTVSSQEGQMVRVNLVDCLARALLVSPDLEQAEINVKLMEARFSEAKSSTILPQLQLTQIFGPAPGIEGELAILPNHAPLLTVLKPGEIRVVKGGEDAYIAVSGGFMEVMPTKVTILADTAERVEEIDIERAQAARDRAQQRVEERPSVTDVDVARAELALARSLIRLKVAEKSGQRRGTGVPPAVGTG